MCHKLGITLSVSQVLTYFSLLWTIITVLALQLEETEAERRVIICVRPGDLGLSQVLPLLKGHNVPILPFYLALEDPPQSISPPKSSHTDWPLASDVSSPQGAVSGS